MFAPSVATITTGSSTTTVTDTLSTYTSAPILCTKTFGDLRLIFVLFSFGDIYAIIDNHHYCDSAGFHIHSNYDYNSVSIDIHQ